MKKPEKSVKGRSSKSWPDGAWLDMYPCLVEHISDETWEDGSPREVSTLVIRGQDGRVLGALNDRETKCSLYRSGDTVGEVLEALEKVLEDGIGDWRSWSGKGGGKKGGKEKDG